MVFLNPATKIPGWNLTSSFLASCNPMKRMIDSMRRGSANDDIPLPLHNDPHQASSPGTSEIDILHLLCCIHSGETCNSTDCVCLPTRQRVTSTNEYRCRPATLEKPKQLPVFGDNYLTHYSKHPQCLSEMQTVIFNQLPKRACGHLAASHEESALGWGLYFEEGWHWRSV